MEAPFASRVTCKTGLAATQIGRFMPADAQQEGAAHRLAELRNQRRASLNSSPLRMRVRCLHAGQHSIGEIVEREPRDGAGRNKCRRMLRFPTLASPLLAPATHSSKGRRRSAARPVDSESIPALVSPVVGGLAFVWVRMSGSGRASHRASLSSGQPTPPARPVASVETVPVPQASRTLCQLYEMHLSLKARAVELSREAVASTKGLVGSSRAFSMEGSTTGRGSIVCVGLRTSLCRATACVAYNGLAQRVTERNRFRRIFVCICCRSGIVCPPHPMSYWRSQASI